jgi:hypothetical protein
MTRAPESILHGRAVDRMMRQRALWRCSVWNDWFFIQYSADLPTSDPPCFGAPMTASTRTRIEQHWSLANARDWDGFARLLAPDLVYEVPQTRERIVSAAGYLDLFCTWPQPWRADVRQLLVDGDSAMCRIDFVTGDETQTGISLFELKQGLITRVTDYWPEAYEPPPRVSTYFTRY